MDDDDAASRARPGDRNGDLEVAFAAADAADAFTLPNFRARDFTVDWKTNATEVTEIDRAAERIVVGVLTSRRPRDGAFGEEHGQTGDSDATRQWIVDPIDGTSGFVRGIPVWATLIALVDDGTPVLGVVSAPALGFRWWGGQAIGSFVRSPDGATRTMQVSNVDDLADAQVSITHSSGWDRLGLTERLISLQRRSRRSRGMGDFWQHMLVAEGAIDVAIDAIGVAAYDLAALQPIVEGAGGRFTDRRGEPTYLHDSAVSTNAVLHDEVIAALASN